MQKIFQNLLLLWIMPYYHSIAIYTSFLSHAVKILPIKACVRYFLSKCNLFHLESSFRSRDIQIFVIFSLTFHTFQIQKDKCKWNNL